MRKNINIFARLDWLTIGIYLFLLAVGWISVYGALYSEDSHAIFDLTQFYGKHLLWIVSAFVLAFVVLSIDSKFYSVLANPIYIGVMVLLVLVLVFGVEVNNARAWFEIGPMRLQPSELAKVATCLALARLMSVYGFSIKRTRNLAKIAFIILLPAGLILLEPDPGSALVFLSFLLMLYREGLSGWFVSSVIFVAVLFILAIIWTQASVLLFLLILCLLVFVFLNQHYTFSFLSALFAFGAYYAVRFLFPKIGIMSFDDEILLLAISGIFIVIAGIYAIRKKAHNVWIIIIFFIGSTALSYSVDIVFEKALKPHHRDRIEVLLGLKDDVKNTGYNVNQSKIAIGSGGLTGKGFLQGTQNKYDFLPKQSKHTDFIFCTIGEEWGFLGAFAVLAAYLTLLIRLVFISERQRDTFGRVYGYCVVSVLFTHILINIAMTVGLAPVIGIPLPFISYGGTSLWAFTIMLFILLKIDSARWS